MEEEIPKLPDPKKDRVMTKIIPPPQKEINKFHIYTEGSIKKIMVKSPIGENSSII